ncbi:hypothetical protein EFP17_28480 [Burkholderia glumae]|nr:hypothetical protein EFP17_28480 [Burkholderia glumae]
MLIAARCSSVSAGAVVLFVMVSSHFDFDGDGDGDSGAIRVSSRIFFGGVVVSAPSKVMNGWCVVEIYPTCHLARGHEQVIIILMMAVIASVLAKSMRDEKTINSCDDLISFPQFGHIRDKVCCAPIPRNKWLTTLCSFQIKRLQFFRIHFFSRKVSCIEGRAARIRQRVSMKRRGQQFA